MSQSSGTCRAKNGRQRQSLMCNVMNANGKETASMHRPKLCMLLDPCAVCASGSAMSGTTATACSHQDAGTPCRILLQAWHRCSHQSRICCSSQNFQHACLTYTLAVSRTQMSAKLQARTVPTPGAAVRKTGLGLSGMSLANKSPDLLASTRRCKRGLVTTTLIFLIASL